MGPRTYERALELLSSRKTRRSAKPTYVPPGTEIPKAASLRGTPHIQGISTWLKILGHDPANLENVIHVAGTNGKGSVCNYTDVFLRQRASRLGHPTKTGLYTSPYLDEPNEMIRINGRPISDECFAHNFFEVWEGLNLDTDTTGLPKKLQLLFILCVHTFIKEAVDVAIIETHHGGSFDVTNVISQPVVTAITSISLDHLQELGGSIETIAWHKSGVFKAEACALSVYQDNAVALVLAKRAKDIGVSLRFISPPQHLYPGLQEDAQNINANLAKAIVNAFLNRKLPGHSLSCNDIESGIRNAHWPGRFQIIREHHQTWYLDGAHNPAAAEVASRWFNRVDKPTRAEVVLVFGLDGDRHQPLDTLARLRDSISEPASSLFLTSDTGVEDLTHLSAYAQIWLARYPNARILVVKRHDVVVRAREHGTHVLVTGSLWLVSVVLKELSSN